MTVVLGIDSSTQSTKVLAVDADSGRILGQARAAHPDGTEVDPDRWWAACNQAMAEVVDGLSEPVAAISVAGQQHGMVTVDSAGESVRPALLWNDTRSAPQAAELVSADGPEAWARRTGLVPVASFTVTKLAWLSAHEPDNADRVDSVLLPHDWLTWRLAGGGTAEACTDRGDASGTGYFSGRDGVWLPEVLGEAFGGRRPRLPRVLGPVETAGRGPGGAILGAGTGDNMAAGLGLAAGPGDVVISLGTSGTVFAVTEDATEDPTGIVAGFCDATGRFLPLVCTLNAARVLTAAAAMLDTDLAGLDELALRAEPGAGGLTLLPYLDGERTPNLPDATGTLLGLRRDNMTPENLARAAVEGMLCGLAEGLVALRDLGVAVRRVLLVGGAARSAAVQKVAPELFGVPVEVPEPGEYVALGAARQAAWALAGGEHPPAWPVESVRFEAEGGSGSAVWEAHAQARQTVHGRIQSTDGSTGTADR
ncbi:xylulokinase [Actinoalloteichus hoggarensis]|uniref:Xylulose kinase n=1 Tax=Actinoalloteichus hoggarensis TaxID=1470176 RepID=A0A221WBH3_9PSEU|nr:xylulokinase [Actinoalloteichus hoggarensis]ASO22627.1 Xylulose kinase [Actinoalloteichus hoggarensis]MBB5924230.1 xylulokinase [Actinoalloteichus hoggarensis]